MVSMNITVRWLVVHLLHPLYMVSHLEGQLCVCVCVAHEFRGKFGSLNCNK